MRYFSLIILILCCVGCGSDNYTEQVVIQQQISTSKIKPVYQPQFRITCYPMYTGSSYIEVCEYLQLNFN